MDKKIAKVITAILIVLAVIFAVFGKAGSMSDTVWGAQQRYTFGECKSNVHLYLLKNAEAQLNRDREREAAHKIDFLNQKESLVQEEQQRKECEAEVAYMAKVIYAEGWIEGPLGWRLIVDVLLNRIDSPRFPNDIWSVVSQKNQFETYSNGQIAKAPVKQEIVNVVLEEMAARTNRTVLFFTAGSYNKYCIPMFKYKHHYFGR